jgi:hypothetical protein
MTGYLWRSLEALDGSQSATAVDRLATGKMHDGYHAVWALSASALVVLSEEKGASRIVPLSTVGGVLCDGQSAIRVLAGSSAISLLWSPNPDGFAAELGRRALVPVGGGDAALSATGLVSLAGDVGRLSGQFLGGYRELPPRAATLALDDVGAHLLSPPWWRNLLLPWADVRDVLIEGHEQTVQRVSALGLMAFGTLALAMPGEENLSRSYLTLAAADGELIFRVDGQSPQQLRVQLRDVVREHGDAARKGGLEGLGDQLAKVTQLHASGALTDEEFQAAKRKLLGI